jgi:hypothetical protein
VWRHTMNSIVCKLVARMLAEVDMHSGLQAPLDSVDMPAAHVGKRVVGGKRHRPLDSESPKDPEVPGAELSDGEADTSHWLPQVCDLLVAAVIGSLKSMHWSSLCHHTCAGICMRRDAFGPCCD